MKRLVYSFLVAAALAQAPITVQAQTGTTGTTSTLAFSQNLQVNVDGEKLDNQQYVYIGSSRCTKETKFRFIASGYVTGSSSISNLEFWASAGTGTDCTQAANRMRTTTAVPQCWFVGAQQSVTSKADQTFAGTDIFRGNAEDDSGDCPQVSNTPYTVYLVPLETPTESNPTMPPAPITGIQLLKATFTLSITTPDAPSKIKGNTGESELTVSWTKPSDFKTKSKFYVVYDTGLSSEDSTCSETQLKADEAPPAEDGDTIYYSDSTQGTKASLKGLDAKGVEIGQYVAAAVVHRDQAGNDSNMSDVVCVQRVDVVTPLEQCDEDPNCKGDFDKCSLQPGADRSWSLAAFALLVLSLSLFARRRLV